MSCAKREAVAAFYVFDAQKSVAINRLVRLVKLAGAVDDNLVISSDDRNKWSLANGSMLTT
ncbi:hypothetical protein SP19_88 [Salmonella phage 19]|nr:hypothetical protein SP19_88 [Salmonella phage 19]